VTTLTLKSIGVSYGSRTALTDVSLVVPSGSLVAILGPSGCGKTSLLMALAGLVPINAGSITVGSRELSSASHRIPPEQRGIGWVPQAASLFPHLSVGDNIGFGLSRGRRRQERVEELAALVGLAGFTDRSPGQLSGGQAQRVALARALAPSPDVLLLDEPFGALDSVLRHSLAREVAGILREQDTTAILVTHDREEALDLADFVVVMDQGRIVQVGTPREIYESPATPWVASFVGDTVELTGVWRDQALECRQCGAAEFCEPGQGRLGCSGHVECALGNVAATSQVGEPKDGDTVRVVLRPEWLVPATTGIAATVKTVAYAGHDALVEFELPEQGDLVRARIAAPFLPAVGQDFHLALRHPALVFPASNPAPALA
jgi:iron(III) transport system ATP-binding protein